MALVTDIDWTGSLAAVKDELVRGELAEAAMAMKRQTEIRQATAHVEHRSVEGLGQLTMQIDPGVYHRMQAIYGADCFADPDFRRACLRDNPDMRVNHRSPTTVRVVRAMKNGAIRGRAA